MANSDLINAFNDCIDRLINGQNIKDCLQLYPQYRDMLLPMLEAGRVVQRVRVDAAETSQAQIRVRSRVQQAIMTPTPRAVYPYQRLAALTASFVLAIVIAIAGAAAYSQQTLPGDTLYDLKLFAENIQLSLSSDNTLKQQFASRRITEIQQLLSAGRMELVTFEGKIAAQNEGLWQVASLAVEIPDRIADLQFYKVGDLVRVDGVTTTQGTILASQIVLLESGEQTLPTPLPPTVTPLPTKTPSLTPTITISPSPMPTQQPSATTSPSPTNLLTTATPIPPSATSLPVTPSPTACAPVQPDGWVIYRVQAGNTLSQLASSTDIPLDELMTVNCLTDPARIVVGEQLYLPRPVNVNPTASAPQQSTVVSPPATDDHGGGSNSGSGGGDDGGGHGGGSDDGSGHG